MDGSKRSEMVTNASLRLKKMPEDITLVVEDDNKGSHFADSKFSSSLNLLGYYLFDLLFLL